MCSAALPLRCRLVSCGYEFTTLGAEWTSVTRPLQIADLTVYCYQKLA